MASDHMTEFEREVVKEWMKKHNIKEIAESLGKPEALIYSTLYKARKKLKKQVLEMHCIDDWSCDD